MKKIIFATICLIAIMSAQETKAQYADYYYHRVGDTLEWRSPIGYYSWWEWEDFYNDHLRLCANRGGTWGVVIGSQDSAIMLQRFYTPTPLKIIGIAGACFRGNGSTYWTAPDTNDKQDYLFIYDAGPGDTFDLVSQTPWSPFDPKRYIHVKTYPYLRTYDTDHCCIDADAWDIYLPISEYYFDSAIYVTDSFYVGGSFFGNRPVIGNLAETFRTTYMVASVQLTGSQPCSELQYVSSQGCTFPDVTMKLRTCQNWAFGGGDYTFADNIWTWHPHFYESVVIFPLIEVDTTVPPQDACDSVSNVQATVSGTSAVITWDGFPNHTSLLLKYGSCALPRDLWQQVDVTDLTLYTLTDLNPSSCYRVSIKPAC